MFDFSWGEIMLIGVVALIVIGPKELPGVLRAFGQWVGKVRRMAGEFQSQFQEAMREAEMADLKKHVDELNDTARSLHTQYDPLKDFDSSSVGPASSPTSAVSSPAPLPADAGPPSTSPGHTDSSASSVDVSVPPPVATPQVAEKDLEPSPSASATPPHEERRA